MLRYDGRTGTFLDVFVASGSGGLDGPTDLLFGPDGHLYVSSFHNSRVLRYNGGTGAFLDEFVDPGSGGLVNPEGLVFGPDGEFYVSNSAPGVLDSVLRYDGTTGAFRDEFAAVGSGGLDGAGDLLFGPDGNLYVASGETDSVLRYNGTTGAFSDAFVAAGSGGLDFPFGLAFGPDGNFYVSNRLGNNVLRYHGTGGSFIDAFAAGGGLNQPAYFLFTPADQLEGNATLASATPIGAGPGVHLPDLTIHDSSDQDWYRFELLRGDSLDVAVGFVPASGPLGFEVTDGSGAVLATGTPTGSGAEATLTNLAAGSYYLHVWGVSGATNHYGVAVEPAAASTTRVFYVNDGSRYQDYYTLAVGNDANDGLTPDTPKATLQDVLADYDLGLHDLVVIDTGAYGEPTVTIRAEDEAAAYAGTPSGSRFTYGGTRGTWWTRTSTCCGDWSSPAAVGRALPCVPTGRVRPPTTSCGKTGSPARTRRFTSRAASGTRSSATSSPAEAGRASTSPLRRRSRCGTTRFRTAGWPSRYTATAVCCCKTTIWGRADTVCMRRPCRA